MNVRKALITGGAGFAGSNLARRLLRDGWDVHVITGSANRHELLLDVAADISFHAHDGSAGQMNAIVGAVRPTVVFHLAALFLSEHTSDQIEALIKSNIVFGTQLLDAMAAHNVRLLVNTGTSWEHYCNSSYSPVNLYAATKHAFESIIRYYVDAASLQAVTLKLFDTYGPKDPRPKLFTLLRKVALDQKPLAMSPGEQLLDLVFIDDVVEAFVLAAERLLADEVKGHECYAVSSGQPIRLKDLVELYQRVTSRLLPIVWGERPYRRREVMIPWNNGLAVPEWRPRIGLEEGLRLMEQDLFVKGTEA